MPLTRAYELCAHDSALQVATIVDENCILTKLVRKMADHHLVHDANRAAHWQDGAASGSGNVDDQLPDLVATRVIDHQGLVVIAKTVDVCFTVVGHDPSEAVGYRTG
jgi:hypothetical protein